MKVSGRGFRSGLFLSDEKFARSATKSQSLIFFQKSSGVTGEVPEPEKSSSSFLLLLEATFWTRLERLLDSSVLPGGFLRLSVKVTSVVWAGGVFLDDSFLVPVVVVESRARALARAAAKTDDADELGRLKFEVDGFFRELGAANFVAEVVVLLLEVDAAVPRFEPPNSAASFR